MRLIPTQPYCTSKTLFSHAEHDASSRTSVDRRSHFDHKMESRSCLILGWTNLARIKDNQPMQTSTDAREGWHAVSNRSNKSV